MATSAFKLDPSLEPLSKSLRDSVESQSGRVNNALSKALGKSDVHGEGFKKVKDIIQDVGGQMTQALAEGITADENLKSAFVLNALNALNKAANDNLEQNLENEIAKKTETSALDNLNADQAITDFGNSVLPEVEQDAQQITQEALDQSNLVTAPLGTGAANDNQEEVSTVTQKNSPKQPTNKTTPDKEELPPENIDANTTKKEVLPKPVRPVDSVEPTESEEQPTSIPKPLETTSVPTDQSPTPEPITTALPATPSEQKIAPEPSLPPTAPPPKTADPEIQADEQPEVPEKITEPLDALLPLIETDEDNPLLPKKILEESTKANQEQAQNQDSENQDSAQNNEGSPQTNPERGKITQGINFLRNRAQFAEIDQEVQAIYEKIKQIQKDIKELSDKITPVERKINLYRIAYWSSFVVMIFLYLIAAILALTIIFLFIIPIAPFIWGLAEIPSASCTAINHQMDSLKKEIEDDKKKKEKKEEELKKYQGDLKTLAIKRHNLKNQSLLSAGNPNQQNT